MRKSSIVKIIKTSSFDKLSKEKEWDPNPWAVCNTNIDKDKEPEKFESCVQKVKSKQCKDFEEGLKKELKKDKKPEIIEPFKR